MKDEIKISVILRVVAAVLLLWALDRHAYGYYTLLRWVVCGTAVFSAYLALELEKKGWIWVMGIIALLFNPIIPVHLSREKRWLRNSGQFIKVDLRRILEDQQDEKTT